MYLSAPQMALSAWGAITNVELCLLPFLTLAQYVWVYCFVTPAVPRQIAFHPAAVYPGSFESVIPISKCYHRWFVAMSCIEEWVGGGPDTVIQQTFQQTTLRKCPQQVLPFSLEHVKYMKGQSPGTCGWHLHASKLKVTQDYPDHAATCVSSIAP